MSRASLHKLRAKLCRELARCEHDAIVHCTREAWRYGRQPPGQSLRAIADHAHQVGPALERVWGRQPPGARAGRAVAAACGALRDLALGRRIDAERAYRDTLLALRDGLDVARLLRAVLVQQQDYDALRACDALLAGRDELLTRVEASLRWFAQHPDVAWRSARPRARKRVAPSPGVARASS